MAQIKITRWVAYREGDWPFDYDCLMTLKSEDMARRTGDKNIIGLSAYIEIPDNLFFRKSDTVIFSYSGIFLEGRKLIKSKTNRSKKNHYHKEPTIPQLISA